MITLVSWAKIVTCVWIKTSSKIVIQRPLEYYLLSIITRVSTFLFETACFYTMRMSTIGWSIRLLIHQWRTIDPDHDQRNQWFKQEECHQVEWEVLLLQTKSNFLIHKIKEEAVEIHNNYRQDHHTTKLELIIMQPLWKKRKWPSRAKQRQHIQVAMIKTCEPNRDRQNSTTWLNQKPITIQILILKNEFHNKSIKLAIAMMMATNQVIILVLELV